MPAIASTVNAESVVKERASRSVTIERVYGEVKSLDRDTGETIKKAAVVVEGSDSDNSGTVKTDARSVEAEQQQKRGIVNKLKSMFKF